MRVSTSEILASVLGNSKDIKGAQKTSTPKSADVLISKEAEVKDFSVKTLLDSLFKDLSINQKSKDTILQTLQAKNIPKNIKGTLSELKSIVDTLKNDKTLLKSARALENNFLDIKDMNSKTMLTQIKNSGIFLESKLAKADVAKSLLPDSIYEKLISIKSVIIKNRLPIGTSNIDDILSSKVANKSFVNSINDIIQSLKPNKNQARIETLARLDNLAKKVQLLESKITNNTPVSNSDIKAVVNEIISKMDEIANPKVFEELKLPIKSLNLQNSIETKFLELNIGEKLQRAVNQIKSELAIKIPKFDSHVEVTKLVQNLKGELVHAIQNRDIVPNQKIMTLPDIKEEILADTKANLLKIKEELSTSNAPNSQDTLLRVDKALNNINYYQLVSLSSNANISYLPLLWEGLDDAQVSIKKLKQKRYFCEINLKLKDFGEIDLLVMLFDDISINISIFTKSDKFLKKVKENLQILRQGINGVGLLPQNIYLLDAHKDSRAKEEMREYVKNQQIGQGVNFYV